MPRRRKTASDALVVQNAAKTLLANIRFASVDHPVKSIVMTSSVPNEGKTTVSYQLAQATASSGKRTLIVECDMRHRSLANLIGARARYGLYAVLSGQVELEDAVVSTSHRNLFFLDSEPHIPNPADILASQRFRNLMHELASSFDYVIFDTPPVGTFVDAAVIAAQADATVLVVRERFVKRADLHNAYDQLKKADAHVIGVAMNMCESESSEYYYAYYNKSGKRVRTSDGNVSEGPQLPVQESSEVELPEERPAPGPSRPQHGATASPSETAQFTAAAQAVRPVNVHREGVQTSGSRFSRR
ncbi:CpsD/CapB family tyrosine-protein kinase [Enorma massiliensis]|uniref:CpsD/CapB family tyrosine-protein kinase n=1 Tax=Enorma massiliensis TaxID=1472761 RepID=UPI003AF0C023